MSLFSIEKPTLTDQKQSRLLRLAALFLLLYSLILTLAPAVRLHAWNVEYRWSHWVGFGVWLVGMVLVNRQLARRLPERDPLLFPIGALLSGWGLLSVSRLDTIMGLRQSAWLAVSLAVFIVGIRIPHLFVLLRRYKYLWLTSGLVLTGLTFLFGVYPGGVGPRLWLGCCGVYLQPSEPLKLLLIAYLAAYLSDHLPVSFSLLQLLTPTLILFGLALGLLVIQRDLGTASLFILIYTVIIYIASQRRRVLIISFAALIAAGLTGYLLFGVVRVRVDAWINPWRDPAGGSYQIIQSLIAVASGGIFGQGPGMGSPGVVPVAHSDFIFASLAEETGMLGAAGLLLLFVLLVGRGFRAAMFATNNYRRYLASGITAYLAIQAIFIVGGNLRLLPLTGVTLPFVSYGGSSLVTAFISLMILVLISNPGEEEPAPLHNPTPYYFTSGGLVAGLLLLAMAAGYWGLIRAPMLLSRPENPRRVITDRFVKRGALLDRNGLPINQTIGEPGSYTREYVYPALSGTTGYNSPLYGQAGLESGLDDLLRGLRGNPDTLILADEILYGQTPPGVDVRLSIDLALQKKVDLLLQGHKGALVLLDAATGEVLAISSHPNTDPTRLDETWAELIQDPDGPLLNRATQGSYPPGGALGPFLLAFSSRDGELPSLIPAAEFRAGDRLLTCAVPPDHDANAGNLITNGCPAPAVQLGRQIGAQELGGLLDRLGFYESPGLPLAVAPASDAPISQVDLAAIGQENLKVTPMQMALAAAALTAGGERPSPQLALAMHTPDVGWVNLPAGAREDTLLGIGAETAVSALAVKDQSYWQTIAAAHSSEQDYTWYLAGTLPQQQGTPLALALILEENNPPLAAQIGKELLAGAGK